MTPQEEAAIGAKWLAFCQAEGHVPNRDDLEIAMERRRARRSALILQCIADHAPISAKGIVRLLHIDKDRARECVREHEAAGYVAMVDERPAFRSVAITPAGLAHLAAQPWNASPTHIYARAALLPSAGGYGGGA